MHRIVFLCVFTLGLGACGDDQATPRVGRKTPKASTKKGPKSSKGKGSTTTTAKPAFSYSPVGKRDPFRSYLATAANTDTKGSKRRIQATEEFELEQYTLTALVTGTSQPRAMVEDPKGVGHTVRVGSRLGKRGGRVARIANRTIVVVEEYRDPASGKRVRVPITVRLPADDIEGILTE